MKKLTNMQKLRKYAKWAKAEYGTDIIVSYDGKVYFRRKLISDWHKEMWEWLAVHPDKDKLDFFEARIIGRKHTGYITMLNVHNLCFACFYNDILEGWLESELEFTSRCTCCPFGQSANGYCEGLYEQYDDAYKHKNYEEVNRIAKEIANLEWKWRDGNEIQE